MNIFLLKSKFVFQKKLWLLFIVSNVAVTKMNSEEKGKINQEK